MIEAIIHTDTANPQKLQLLGVLFVYHTILRFLIHCTAGSRRAVRASHAR